MSYPLPPTPTLHLMSPEARYMMLSRDGPLHLLASLASQKKTPTLPPIKVLKDPISESNLIRPIPPK